MNLNIQTKLPHLHQSHHNHLSIDQLTLLRPHQHHGLCQSHLTHLYVGQLTLPRQHQHHGLCQSHRTHLHVGQLTLPRQHQHHGSCQSHRMHLHVGQLTLPRPHRHHGQYQKYRTPFHTHLSTGQLQYLLRQERLDKLLMIYINRTVQRIFVPKSEKLLWLATRHLS